MTDYNPTAENDSDAQNESEILEGEARDAEILTDGGVAAAQRTASIPEDDDYLYHTEGVQGGIISPIGGGILEEQDYPDAYGRLEILPITSDTVQLAAVYKAEAGSKEIELSVTPELSPEQAEQLGRELIESAKGARMEAEK